MTDIVDGRLAFETKTTPQEIACECEQARRELSTEILHEHPDIVKRVKELAATYPNFTPPFSDPEMEKQAVSFLLKQQEDSRFLQPDYHISAETLPFLLGELRKNLNIQETKAETTNKNDDRRTIMVIRDELLIEHKQGSEAYFRAFQVLLNDPAALTKKFQAIADDRDDIEFDGVFSSALDGRIKLIATNIAALQAMAGASPDYAAEIEQAGVDVTDRSAVQGFVLASGFLADQAVSEEVKADVAKKLGLPPHVSTTTGTNVDSALDAQNLDGTTRFGADNPLPVRKGLSAYVRSDGMRIARVDVKGIGVREIPWQRGEKGETIGLKLSLLKIWAMNEQTGNTDFLGESVHINTLIYNQTDPEKLRRTRQTMAALLGGVAGFDGHIISDHDAEFIGWFNQYVSTKGDAAIGDYDRDTATKNRTDLGLHPNGNEQKIDFEVLQAAGSFAQDQYGSGSPNYYALQKYLHGLFPDRVPLTDKNLSNHHQ